MGPFGNSIKNVYAMPVVMAALNKTIEPKWLILYTNVRSDLVAYNIDVYSNIMFDVRTAVSSLAGICPGTADMPGHATLFAEAK